MVNLYHLDKYIIYLYYWCKKFVNNDSNITFVNLSHYLVHRRALGRQGTRTNGIDGEKRTRDYTIDVG